MKTLNLFVIYEAQLSGYSFESLNVLSILSILTAIFVIITKNPIISVLYLIGLFITIAIYLVLVGISFLGLSYLLVYVGAVSILFLFILMLINVRISELVSDTKNSIPLVFITAISFTIPVTNIIINSEYLSNITKLFNNILYIFNQNSTVFSLCSTNWEKTLVGFSHINSIGNIMYTSHNIWLILVSLILLLAMVGTIVITLKYKDNSKLVNSISQPYNYVNLPLQSNIFSSMFTKKFWKKVLMLFTLGFLLRFGFFSILNIDICIDICNPISIWAYSILYLLYNYFDLLYTLYLETTLNTCSLTDDRPTFDRNIHSAMVKPNEVGAGNPSRPSSRPSSPPIKTEVASPSPQLLDQRSIPMFDNTQAIKSEESGIEESYRTDGQKNTTVKRENYSALQENALQENALQDNPVQENLPKLKVDPLTGDFKTEFPVDQENRRNLGKTVKPRTASSPAISDYNLKSVTKFEFAAKSAVNPWYFMNVDSPFRVTTAEEIQLQRELKVLTDKARDLEWCISSHNSNIGINQEALADKHLSEFKKLEHASELANQIKNKEALYKELSDLSAEARSLVKSENYSISSFLPSPEILKRIEFNNNYAKENAAKKIKLEDTSNLIKSEGPSKKIKLEDSPIKIKSEPKD